MNVIEQLRRDGVERKRAARAVYREVLQRQAAQPGDLEKLREAMAVLGISEAELATDQQLLRKLGDMEAERGRMRADEEADNPEKRRLKLNAIREEQEKLRARLRELELEFGGIHHQADQRGASLGRLSWEIANLKKSSPRLYGETFGEEVDNTVPGGPGPIQRGLQNVQFGV